MINTQVGEKKTHTRLQWMREDTTEEKKNTYESFRRKKERAITVMKRKRERKRKRT